MNSWDVTVEVFLRVLVMMKCTAVNHLPKALHVAVCARSHSAAVSVALWTVYGSFDVTQSGFVGNKMEMIDTSALLMTISNV